MVGDEVAGWAWVSVATYLLVLNVDELNSGRGKEIERVDERRAHDAPDLVDAVPNQSLDQGLGCSAYRGIRVRVIGIGR